MQPKSSTVARCVVQVEIEEDREEAEDSFIGTLSTPLAQNLSSERALEQEVRCWVCLVLKYIVQCIHLSGKHMVVPSKEKDSASRAIDFSLVGVRCAYI